MNKVNKVASSLFKSWQQIEEERRRALEAELTRPSQEELKRSQQRARRLDEHQTEMQRRRKARSEAVTMYDSTIRELLDSFASVALKPSVDTPYAVVAAYDPLGDYYWSIGETGVRVELSSWRSESGVKADSSIKELTFKVLAPHGADKFEMENYSLLAEEIAKRTGLKSEVRRS
jgi:hypothetical protein